MSILRIAFIVLLFAPAPAFAGCMSDHDCPTAARCDRDPGQGAGVCTGGMLPEGPYHHMNPDPYDRSQQEGEGCVTDADCGYSGRCATTTGQMRGVCLSGMGGVSTGGGVRIGIPH